MFLSCVARLLFFFFFPRSTVTHSPHCQIHSLLFSPLIPAIFLFFPASLTNSFLPSEISSSLVVLSVCCLSWSVPSPVFLKAFRFPYKEAASAPPRFTPPWKEPQMRTRGDPAPSSPLPGWLTCKECGGSARELLISLFLGSTDYPQDPNTAPLLEPLTVLPCLMHVWAWPSEPRRLCCRKTHL